MRAHEFVAVDTPARATRNAKRDNALEDRTARGRALMLYVFLSLLLLQEAAATPQYKAEVVVVAERGESDRNEIAGAVTLLDRETIATIPATDLGELLERVEGFRVVFDRAFGGAPMVSSRGFFGGGEVEYVQVIVDGVPMGDPESGLVDWRRIRSADIERIEVLRGPASSLYGDAALGGVIDVTTTHAAGASGGALALGAGSFGSASADVSYHGLLGAGTIGLAGLVSRTDGYREHSSEDHRGVDVSYGGDVGDSSVGVNASYGTRDREDPGPLPSSEIRSPRRSDPLFRFDVDEGWRARLGVSLHRSMPAIPFRVTAYASSRDSEIVRTLLLAPGFGDRIAREIDSRSAGFSALGDRAFSIGTHESRVRAGVDWSRDSIETHYRTLEPEALAAEGEGTRRRAALFAMQEVALTDRLRVVAGMRWDEIRDSFTDSGDSRRTALSPRVGINLQLGAGGNPFVLFGSYSHAFKAPTLDQRFDPRPFPDGSGGTFRISNPHLEPQKGRNLEVGIARDRGSDEFQIVAYRMTVDDEIDFDVSTFTYRNIGRSRHSGVELSARLREASALSPAFSYAWTRVESLVGSHAGNQLKNIPEHILRADLHARLGSGVTMLGSIRWTGEWFLDDANDFAVEDGIVFDVRIARRFTRASLHVDLLNVLDDDSSEIGFTLQGFNGEVVPYEFPAAGFAVRAGVDWRF